MAKPLSPAAAQAILQDRERQIRYTEDILRRARADARKPLATPSQRPRKPAQVDTGTPDETPEI